MKTVGIITCHYFDNFGSVLQAYALRRYINRLPGYHAELINYIPENASYRPYEPGQAGKEELERKRKKFEKFLKEKCGVVDDPVRAVTGNRYDYYCVGSDQLWNFNICDIGQEYFLSNLDASAKKISYATSLGLSVEQLRKSREIFSSKLKSFKAVSVREMVHAVFLREECGVENTCVVDPTFLLNAEDYEELIPKTPVRHKPFVLFLWYMHDDCFFAGTEFANMLSRKYNLPIVNSFVKPSPHIFAKNGGCMMYEGIENYLWYIKNAEVIVTNSYHTTLFSMYFQKPFYVFLEDSMRSRFDTLCSQLPISSRMVTKYISPDEVSLDIDYKAIYEAAKPYIQASKEFLANALDVEG